MKTKSSTKSKAFQVFQKDGDGSETLCYESDRYALAKKRALQILAEEYPVFIHNVRGEIGDWCAREILSDGSESDVSFYRPGADITLQNPEKDVRIYLSEEGDIHDRDTFYYANDIGPEQFDSFEKRLCRGLEKHDRSFAKKRCKEYKTGVYSAVFIFEDSKGIKPVGIVTYFLENTSYSENEDAEWKKHHIPDLELELCHAFAKPEARDRGISRTVADAIGNSVYHYMDEYVKAYREMDMEPDPLKISVVADLDGHGDRTLGCVYEHIASLIEFYDWPVESIEIDERW